MGHPDFRAHGRIFATLYEDGQAGMVKLTPDQQQDFISADPAAFAPASGAWGLQGCTTVRLNSVDRDQLGEAMTLAWKNSAKVAGKSKTKPKKPSSKR
jgi:hypothetical protein